MQSEPTKQSIYEALFISYNASSSKSERTAAETYLQNIKKSKKGLKYSINLFQNTMEAPVLFYCLHVIEYSIDKRWNELDKDCIMIMNKLFLSFIAQIGCNNNLFNSIPNHVRSKTAQVLVKLMKRQYLISWNAFFTHLIQLLQCDDGSHSISYGVWDMFYRFLMDLNWSIHENRNESQQELTLNAKIKDKMRQYDVEQIVEIWYSFLNNYKKYDISLCQQCLMSIDKYISWIPISYSCAPRFLHIFYEFLGNISFREQSVDCLYEIVTKRMESAQKFELLRTMNIVDIVNSIDTKDIEAGFAEAISGLIEGIGIQLIGCCKDNIRKAEDRVFDCYDLCLKYFSHPSFVVNAECCPFLFSFWSMIKRMDMYNNDKRLRDLFNRTVQIISMHLCYPPQYSIHDPDEAEAEFDEYRKNDLDKLILAMTRAYPDYMLHLIANHFSNMCQIISSYECDDKNMMRWQNIESDLHFIYKICEGFHHRNIDDLIRSNSTFGHLFECSLKANICGKYAHPKVLLTYFDIIHRYNVFFESHPQYISQILQSFVACISGTNATLRTQAAYILQKVISKLYGLNANQVNRVLLQDMDMLIQSLGSCLQTYIEERQGHKTEQYDSVDIKNMCAVLGQLVLLNKNDRHKLYQHCNTICGLFMNELKHYVMNRDEWMNSNAVFTSQTMSQYISCVQSFFKPFGFVNNTGMNGDSKQCIRHILIQFTDIVIKSYSCLPNDDDLRQVSIGFVHKAVYILRNDIVNELDTAFKLYIEYMNANNAVFTLQIITMVVVKLRCDFVPILDNMFYPLFQKISNILSSLAIANNRMNTITKVEIQKHLYTLLLKTFQSGCFEIFLSNKNALHFDEIVHYILDGCVISDDLDISIYKTCFTILKEMLSAIKRHPSMKHLFCNKVLKISFDFALHSQYKAKRPEYDRTLKTHIFGIHHLMFKIFGNDVVTNCIGSYLVTQLKLDTNTAKQYCELCIKGNQQRKLKEIILSLRSNNSNYTAKQL